MPFREASVHNDGNGHNACNDEIPNENMSIDPCSLLLASVGMAANFHNSRLFRQEMRSQHWNMSEV